MIWRILHALGCGALACIVAAAYCGFVLAEFGVFTGLAVGIVALGGAAAVGGFAWRRYAPRGRSRKIGWACAMIIAVGSLAMTVPPSEMILGGWDPGVYLHTGAAVARDGSLQITAADLWHLSEDMRADLTRNVSGWDVLFLGMYPIPNGRLSPQFMHLYPALLAMAYALGGVWGALLVNPVLNAVALLVMFWFASKVLGDAWGVVATLLLAINPAQIWQGKFGTAEMLAQVLLFCGFSVLLSVWRNPGRVLPAVGAGTLLGLAFLARYDAILVIVPLVLLLAAAAVDRERRGIFLGVLAGLSPLVLHAAAHLTWVAPCYRVVPHLVLPALAGAVAVIALLFLGGLTDIGAQLGHSVGKRSRAIRMALTMALVVFGVWAWYVRPHLTVDGRVSSLMGWAFNAVGWANWKAALAGADAWNTLYLRSLFGTFGLLTGCAGIVVLIWRAKDRGVLVWVLVSLVSLVVLTTCLFHDHFMMWASRRFVPVVLPLFCVAIAAAAAELHKRVWAWHPRLAPAVSAVLLVMVLVGIAPRSMAMAETREWPGLVRWYDEVVQMIPSDAIVLCDQPGFAAPLRFLYGIHAHEIYGGQTAAAILSNYRDELRELGQPVRVLTMRRQPAMDGVELREIGQSALRSHILEHPKYHVPMHTKGRGGNFVVWQVIFADDFEHREVP
jgi:hypothetical protein